MRQDDEYQDKECQETESDRESQDEQIPITPGSVDEKTDSKGLRFAVDNQAAFS